MLPECIDTCKEAFSKPSELWGWLYLVFIVFMFYFIFTTIKKK